MKGDFYLVFTSIHEVMVHSVRMAISEDLQEVLRDHIDGGYAGGGFSTDKVYRYCQGNRGSFYGSIQGNCVFLQVGMAPTKSDEKES